VKVRRALESDGMAQPTAQVVGDREQTAASWRQGASPEAKRL